MELDVFDKDGTLWVIHEGKYAKRAKGEGRLTFIDKSELPEVVVLLETVLTEALHETGIKELKVYR